MEAIDLGEEERRTERLARWVSLEKAMRAACVTVSRRPVNMNGSITVTLPRGFTSNEIHTVVDLGRRLAKEYDLRCDIEGPAEVEGRVHSIRFSQRASQN